MEATSPEHLGLLAANHFRAILGPEVLPALEDSLSQIRSSTRYVCTSQAVVVLSKVPPAKDIQKAIFRLNQNKSPGPDGLTSGFYKSAWLILGAEVTNAISRFFNNPDMPRATNSTILTLIPKFPGATIIKDYRPISCCNTTYKAISKILVAKLKPLLPAIILPNQTTFIKGRLLIEKCLLASELVSGYHKNKGPKRLTMKVDITKAFDSLSWDFLFKCLTALNLPEIYISWIKACVTSPTYSVGINGRLHGYFKGTRGLRQGDPLSPYLFGLAMNILSQNLNDAAENGTFHYHPKCKESGLTHLCFVDDLLIFSDGSPKSIQGILSVLEKFKRLSGLSISPEKSTFFPCGFSDEEISNIQALSGMPQGSLPIRYLGLPLCTKKLTILNCEPLLLKIRAKISAWTSKYLSFAGRQLLIDTVIAGITNFWCGAFILPKKCIRKINSMCSAYLWKGFLEAGSNARVAWEIVTSPKEEGGLGVKNLELWNRTCAVKLLWMLLCRTESIWVAWIHQNVIKDKSLWAIKPRQTNTWLMNHLLKLRPLIMRWFIIKPGNGFTCNFWADPWTPFGPLIRFIGAQGPRQTGIPLTATVASRWRRDSWNLPAARCVELEQLLCHLTTISLTNTPDKAEWRIGGVLHTSFCSRLIYKDIRETKPPIAWHPIVWFKRGIPKHKFLTWMFTLNRCPTRDRLLAWGISTDHRCLLCNRDAENRDHLFFNCPYSYRVWSSITSKLQITVTTLDWQTNVDTLLHLSGNKSRKYLAILAWQATIFEVWSERNNRMHRHKFISSEALLQRIDRTLRNKISSFRPQNSSLASECYQLWISSPI
ncbi:putative ribonuclease H protein [Cardamine amara subsp. amara]|uniref:Ribonuclease H protein n=1 Tax=Cardamine amara subsp. amara TaxID=228776 RepID=A0ABD0Z4H8_CARAN